MAYMVIVQKQMQNLWWKKVLQTFGINSSVTNEYVENSRWEKQYNIHAFLTVHIEVTTICLENAGFQALLSEANEPVRERPLINRFLVIHFHMNVQPPVDQIMLIYRDYWMMQIDQLLAEGKESKVLHSWP